jgi:hypothetical protein
MEMIQGRNLGGGGGGGGGGVYYGSTKFSDWFVFVLWENMTENVSLCDSKRNSQPLACDRVQQP